MTNTPLVSVIVPAFNRAALLPRALESVIAQTFADWEIVLVDDGSTDASPDVAAEFRRRLGERITLLRQANRGSSAARNRGLAAARGRFVCFLDSDDEFLPRKLERQLELFRRCPRLGLVYSDYSFADLGGAITRSAFDSKNRLAREVPCEPVGPGLWACSDGFFDTLLAGYFIATIVGMVRREALGAGIRFHPGLSYAEEWHFYLQLVRQFPTGFVDEPLCLHHHTAGSLARSDKLANSLRYVQTLRAIHATFAPELTATQRRIVSGNLSRAYEQTGYDALRSGRAGWATIQFARAAYWRPAVRPIAAAIRSAVSAVARRGSGGEPAPATVVTERGDVRMGAEAVPDRLPSGGALNA